MRVQKTPMTRKSSKTLCLLRQQILADRNGKPFEDSTEMIRQIREERTQHLLDISSGKYNENNFPNS